MRKGLGSFLFSWAFNKETITEIMEHRRIPKGVPGNQSLLKAGSHSFPRAAGTVRRWRQQAPSQEQGTRKTPGGTWRRGGEAATGHFRCHLRQRERNVVSPPVPALQPVSSLPRGQWIADLGQTDPVGAGEEGGPKRERTSREAYSDEEGVSPQVLASSTDQ